MPVEVVAPVVAPVVALPVVAAVVGPEPVEVVVAPVEVVVVGLHGPQTPAELPTGMSQVSPAQQSALLVHPPHTGTHEPL